MKQTPVYMIKQADLYDKLSMRERQIMDVLVRLGKASAREVLDNLPDPPSYSSVRALLTIMVNKGYIRHFREGKKYIYGVISINENDKNSMMQKMVRTFFEGSAPKAISSILNFSSQGLSQEDYEALKKMIEEAEKKKDDGTS